MLPFTQAPGKAGRLRFFLRYGKMALKSYT